MISPLIFESLSLDHVDNLAAILLNSDVYRHIGGEPPNLDAFKGRMARVIAGPPPTRSDEMWINFAVRLASTGCLVGLLEATVRGQVAEVAFLFDPCHWGKGYASQGLGWLHERLRELPGKPHLWATTVPENTKSRALLERCGYVQVPAANAPHLLSYDDGDLVYRLRTRAVPT